MFMFNGSPKFTESSVFINGKNPLHDNRSANYQGKKQNLILFHIKKIFNEKWHSSTRNLTWLRCGFSRGRGGHWDTAVAHCAYMKKKVVHILDYDFFIYLNIVQYSISSNTSISKMAVPSVILDNMVLCARFFNKVVVISIRYWSQPLYFLSQQLHLSKAFMYLVFTVCFSLLYKICKVVE